MSDELYGLLAGFQGPEQLIAAAHEVKRAGYRYVEAYTPHAVEGLADALGHRPTRLPWVVFGGGLLGGSLAYYMQWYAAVIGYPIIVAGRRYHSWPAFIPPTFEMTVLGASFAALFGLLFANRLTRLHHPLFNVERFRLASSCRFFLCVEARDQKFDYDKTRSLLEGLQPESVDDVEP